MRKDEERGREGINHFVRKVRSIILISIDHRRTRTAAAEDRKMTTVRASSCRRRLCTLCTRRPTCNPRGGKILRDGCSASAAVCPSVRA